MAAQKRGGLAPPHAREKEPTQKPAGPLARTPSYVTLDVMETFFPQEVPTQVPPEVPREDPPEDPPEDPLRGLLRRHLTSLIFC